LQKMIDSASPELKSLLEDKQIWEYFAAVFMGIKPACSFNLPNPQYPDEELDPKQFQQNVDFVQAMTQLPAELHIARTRQICVVFEPEAVKRTIARNPDIFTDYSFGADLRAYIKAVFEKLDQNYDKKGILFGYPKKAIMEFIRGELRNQSEVLRTPGFTYKTKKITQEDKEFKRVVEFLFTNSGLTYEPS
jgi:hypothetical protein